MARRMREVPLDRLQVVFDMEGGKSLPTRGAMADDEFVDTTAFEQRLNELAADGEMVSDDPVPFRDMALWLAKLPELRARRRAWPPKLELTVATLSDHLCWLIGPAPGFLWMASPEDIAAADWVILCTQEQLQRLQDEAT